MSYRIITVNREFESTGSEIAQAAAERLAREAMGAGGRDNLTVLLCRIRAEAAPPAEKKSFLGRWLERLRRGE